MATKASAKDQTPLKAALKHIDDAERNAIKLMIELDRLARMHPNQMWSVYHSEAATMIRELLQHMPLGAARKRMAPDPPIRRARLKE